MSAIHLHKAPAGQNSLIVQDTLVDAGSMLDPLRPASRTGWWMLAVCWIAERGRYVLGQGSDPLAGQRQAHLTAGPDEKVGAQLLFHLADLV